MDPIFLTMFPETIIFFLGLTVGHFFFGNKPSFKL